MDKSFGYDVVEKFLAPASPGEEPEDRIVIHEHFAAVVAGATHHTQPHVDGEPAAHFATRVIAKAIKTLGPGTGPNRFTARLTNVLGAACEAKGIDDRQVWPAASVVCLSVPRREVWRIGSGSLAFDGKVHYGNKSVHQAANAFRAVVNAANLEKGMPISAIRRTDPGAIAAQAVYDAQPFLMNKTGRWGFGGINGADVPTEFIEVFELPPGPCSVVLASDGFPEIRPTLGQTMHRLELLQADDPAGIDRLWTVGSSVSPGDASMEDLAYLRLSVS